LQWFRRVCVSLSNPVLRFIMSVNLSICPRVSVRLPTDEFPWNLIPANSTKICQGNTNVVQIGRKYQTSHEDLNAFHRYGRHKNCNNTEEKNSCVSMAKLSILTFLTAICVAHKYKGFHEEKMVARTRHSVTVTYIVILFRIKVGIRNELSVVHVR